MLVFQRFPYCAGYFASLTTLEALDSQGADVISNLSGPIVIPRANRQPHYSPASDQDAGASSGLS
jgi:hypothetical protein